MEQMEIRIGELLKELEKQSFSPKTDKSILEAGKTYPKQIASELTARSRGER